MPLATVKLQERAKITKIQSRVIACLFVAYKFMYMYLVD